MLFTCYYEHDQVCKGPNRATSAELFHFLHFLLSTSHAFSYYNWVSMEAINLYPQSIYTFYTSFNPLNWSTIMVPKTSAVYILQCTPHWDTINFHYTSAFHSTLNSICTIYTSLTLYSRMECSLFGGHSLIVFTVLICYSESPLTM